MSELDSTLADNSTEKQKNNTFGSLHTSWELRLQHSTGAINAWPFNYQHLGCETVTEATDGSWADPWKCKEKIRQEEAVREQNQELSSASIVGESHDNPIDISGDCKKTLQHREDSSWADLADGTWSTILENLHVYSMWSRTTQSSWMPCERHCLPQVGHFGAQCFSKLKNLLELKQGASVRAGSRLPVDSDTVGIDSRFLDIVSETTGQTAWVVLVFVCKQILDFKVVTGAEVTLFSLTGNCVVPNVLSEQDA